MAVLTDNQVLFVAWQDPTSRRYYPVGRLVHAHSPEGQAYYEFAYTQGAREAAQSGFEAFLAFPDDTGHFGQVYRSGTLFPFFQNRLMSRSRADYAEYVSRLGLDPASADPITILSRSGGVRSTDTIELFSWPTREFDPTRDGTCYQTFFVIHGIRHLTEAEQERVLRLQPGEALQCEPEPENPADPYAMLLLTIDGMKAGYMPRYLAPDAGHLRDQCNGVHVEVAQVNPPPAPLAHRVLCRMRACWPEGFKPFQSELCQPIPAAATRPEAL